MAPQDETVFTMQEVADLAVIVGMNLKPESFKSERMKAVVAKCNAAAAAKSRTIRVVR